MWSNSQFPTDFFTFAEKILNEKLAVCSVPREISPQNSQNYWKFI